jgi:hypothetical protein
VHAGSNGGQATAHGGHLASSGCAGQQLLQDSQQELPDVGQS